MSLPFPAWSVAAFEVPTAAKWSQLGTNDDALAAGTGLDAGAVVAAKIGDEAVTATKISDSAITLGYASRTTDFTTTSTSLADVTSLSVAVTVPAGGRRVKISFGCRFAVSSAAAGQGYDIVVYDTTASAEIGRVTITSPGTNYATNAYFIASHVPAAGARTYKIQALTASGTLTLSALTIAPAFILAEAI